MTAANVPLQVIACCDADGAMQPLRFRFEDAAHMLHTVQVREVVDCRESGYVGIEAFFFLCRAVLDGREKLYELKYTVHSHRWALLREIY